MVINNNNCFYIISLKYAPGLKKEFSLLGNKLEEYGWKVRYLLSYKYEKLSDIYLENVISMANLSSISLSRILNNIHIDNPNFILFYNVHPIDSVILRYIKLFYPKCQTIYFMHEPYKTRKHNYSPQKRLLILLREYLQSSSLIYLDHVILPSQLAVSLFSKRYPKYRGQTHYAPLLIPELGQSTRKVERKCFSYVGNIHSATGFDKFVNLVQYVRNYELDFHFSIITSSNIPLQLKKIIAHNLSRVNCINKDVILDREIYDLVERSIGVFRLDQEITQSGIIPICFMLGTPVIVNDLAGFTQHVQHGYNGYVIQDITDYNNMILGMKYLQDNFNDLSRNARQSFESIWSKDNWERYYSWLIK